MPTLAWILLWASIVSVLAVLVVRERRSGRGDVRYDADALRGQSDAEARIRGSINGPNVGGTGHLG